MNNDNNARPTSSLSRYIWRFLLVAAVWGIPSFIILYALFNVIESNIRTKITFKFTAMEDMLQHASNLCRHEVYFKNLFNNLFSDLKGIPARSEPVEQIIGGFKRKWPDGMLDIHVFNGEMELIGNSKENKRLEEFFAIITRPYTEPLIVPQDFEHRLAPIIPSPITVLRDMKSRPGQMIFLGGIHRFSWGFFHMQSGVAQGRTGGILIFIHQQKLPREEVLRQALAGQDFASVGYILEDGTADFPGSLKALNPDKMREKMHGALQNRFTEAGLLISTLQQDTTTSLIAATDIPNSKTITIWVMVLFFLASLAILSLSFRAVVLEEPLWIQVGFKLTGFFGLSFALPVITAGLLAHLYTSESRESHYEQHREAAFQRLAEIDTGFDRFVNSRQMDFRSIIATLSAHVETAQQIVKEADRLYEENQIDQMHIVSSQSEFLLSHSFSQTEIRRWEGRSLKERLGALESWVERGALLHKMEIERLTSENIDSKSRRPPQPFEEMLKKLFMQTGKVAIDTYNSRHSPNLQRQRKPSDLAMETIIESETSGFFNSIKTTMSGFIPLQGAGEHSLVFLDILAGPAREAWFAVIIYNNLVSFERAYLSQIFNRSEESPQKLNIKGSEDIRALSDFKFTPNFPEMHEYRTFPEILKLMEGASRPQWRIMELNGETSMVCALKCSFLRHFTLVAITPVKEIEEAFKPTRNRIIACFAFILLFGIALGNTLAKRFLVPVNELAEGMNAMKEKRFEFRLPIRSEDEFGILAGTFNQAIKRLEELEVARTLQSQILPEEQCIAGNYEITGKNVMTQSVGGDYFDFIPLRYGLMAIIMSDVSGHGVSGALVTAMAKAAFSILCPRYPEDPEIVMEKINAALLKQLNRTKMMTSFLGILDPTNERMFCVNAGQCYPLTITKSGEHEYVRMPSMPLGVRSKIKCVRHDIDLKDRILLLFSDGAPEALNEESRQFGYERFAVKASEAVVNNSKDPLESIFSTLREYTGKIPWGDDITLLIIRKKY